MDKENTYEPLVSVGVLSYNSAKTILETLESIKAQTYKNIELIISDDASKDDTVEVCKKWIEENKGRFARCEILTVPENTGIPANANRRLAASQGAWSKGVAADDILLPDCIENFVNYVKENPQAEVVFSNLKIYHNNFNEENFKEVDDMDGKYFCQKYGTAEKQYQALLRRFYCHAPTMFAKTSVLQKVKYDERIKGMEDYPMWLRLTKAGVAFHFMDKETVCYRRSISICKDVRDPRKKLRFFLNTVELFKRLYVYDNLGFFRRLCKKYSYCRLKLFDKMGLLKEGEISPFSKNLLITLDFILSPQAVYFSIKNACKKIFRQK
ncbi:MAG: glycosyltransferase [Opitutales bacterium]|nr:glycosyltransferase [Opitutales bacterium]